ncbi:MAG: hypothetical protein NVS3B7_00820 [Candidatus Elarobacter sp.]
MTCFSGELESHLRPLRERYNAVVNGWFAEGTFGITYPALLVETYHYVRHSCALMDRARELLTPEFAGLREYLAVHRAEECGHEQWLLDDLGALGYRRAEVMASQPLAETVALVGSQLYVIDFMHPAGLLGYVYVMESKPPTPTWLERIRLEAGVPSEAMTFLARHGEADLVHRRELAEILDAHFADPAARRAALAGATFGLSNVATLFERLRHGDFLLTWPSLHPSPNEGYLHV